MPFTSKDMQHNMCFPKLYFGTTGCNMVQTEEGLNSEVLKYVQLYGSFDKLIQTSYIMENTVFDANLQALCSQGPIFLWLHVTQITKEDNETMAKGPMFPSSKVF